MEGVRGVSKCPAGASFPFQHSPLSQKQCLIPPPDPRYAPPHSICTLHSKPKARARQLAWPIFRGNTVFIGYLALASCVDCLRCLQGRKTERVIYLFVLHSCTALVLLQTTSTSTHIALDWRQELGGRGWHRPQQQLLILSVSDIQGRAAPAAMAPKRKKTLADELAELINPAPAPGMCAPCLHLSACIHCILRVQDTTGQALQPGFTCSAIPPPLSAEVDPEALGFDGPALNDSADEEDEMPLQPSHRCGLSDTRACRTHAAMQPALFVMHGLSPALPSPPLTCMRTWLQGFQPEAAAAHACRHSAG